MHDRLAVHGNAGGPRLSAPSICPIAEGVIKYRGALGKLEINTGAWAPAKPGLIRLPNRRDHDDCLLDADRGGDDATAKPAPSSLLTCMGLFLSSDCFWVFLTVLCSERERPFFVPSPAIRFPERAEGVKGPKR